MSAPLVSLALALLLTGSTGSEPLPEPEIFPGATEGWTSSCDEAGESCTIWTERLYPNLRGGNDALSIGLRVDEACASLHVTLDRPVDTDLPASLAIDGGAPHPFYKSDELTGLAGAIDASRPPPGNRPEFAAFAAEVQAGKLAAGTEAAAELVARFAYIKEPLRLAVGCPATERILQQLKRGGVLRLAFYERPARSGALYDWPQLGWREVVVPLGGLATELEALPPSRPRLR
jgi:hypothetical protein